MARRCLVAAAQERLTPYRLTPHGGDGPVLAGHRRRLLGRARGRVLDLSLRPNANRDIFAAGDVQELTVVAGGPAPAEVWVPRGRGGHQQGPAGGRGVGGSGQLSDVRLMTGSLHADTFPPASFDTIVSVLTLCTVDVLGPMLDAIARWLGPGGQMLVLEHVRATGFTAMAQAMVTPFERRVLGGCRLDQDVIGACWDADLELTDAARFGLRMAGSLPIPCLAGVARLRARNRGLSQ